MAGEKDFTQITEIDKRTWEEWDCTGPEVILLGEPNWEIHINTSTCNALALQNICFYIVVVGRVGTTT